MNFELNTIKFWGAKFLSNDKLCVPKKLVMAPRHEFWRIYNTNMMKKIMIVPAQMDES